MSVLVAVLGAGVGAGLLLVASGWSTHSRQQPRALTFGPSDAKRRLLLAAALGLPTAVVTRWPVAAVGVAAVGWFWPELLGSHASRERETLRTEAVAAWTEMLRDTISGAHGLEEAIVSTAPVAPAPIAREVAELSNRLERHPLVESLRAFADDLAHPAADLVVTSLTLSAQGAVGDLVELLGTLAVAARDEAGMRLRVEAARARLRTAVRVITGCTVTMALGLVVLNRSYLDVYGTALGQVVLAVVVVLWGLALWWIADMGEFIVPDRFLAVPDAGERS